ncbi:hypothetical protein ABE426_08600 [Sphingobacterium faecium]|uniref:hypothetical protein n=1 Tax=Sphingobacterium faecium TaxID=34087 RepID=UPI00320A8676
MHISQHFFKGHLTDLFGALFIPDVQVHSWGYLVCHPFAEEKKSGQKTLVDLSRRLAAQGNSVLMFDFQGCGDSGGSIAQTTIRDWQLNISHAIDFLKQKTGLKKITLIGLRSAATLLLSPAVDKKYVKKLLLLEPVPSLIKHMDDLIKQKLVNDLLTYGKIETNKRILMDHLLNGRSIDLNGYEISAEFYQSCIDFDRELETMTLQPDLDIDVISISVSGVVSKDCARFYQKFMGDHPAQVHAIKLDAFWNKVDGVKADALWEIIDQV